MRQGAMGRGAPRLQGPPLPILKIFRITRLPFVLRFVLRRGMQYATQQYGCNTMKKAMAFRLSDEARLRLAQVASLEGKSATRILEDLILGTGVEVVGAVDTKVDTPPAPRPKQVEPEILPPTASPKMVGTKFVQEIQKPAWKNEPVVPREPKVGLTGKPFGPVPKGKK